MLQGLELRVPFLDHPLVEFTASLPDRMKIRRLTKKYLLRHAAKPFLPAEHFTKPKQGFGSPLGSWLRHELNGYLKDALSPARLSAHGLFRAATVERLIGEHDARVQSHERPLFAMLMFQKWWERYQ
jgi:asparagine synthase (glutamine-hydrolysing)